MLQFYQDRSSDIAGHPQQEVSCTRSIELLHVKTTLIATLLLLSIASVQLAKADSEPPGDGYRELLRVLNNKERLPLSRFDSGHLLQHFENRQFYFESQFVPFDGDVSSSIIASTGEGSVWCTRDPFSFGNEHTYLVFERRQHNPNAGSKIYYVFSKAHIDGRYPVWMLSSGVGNQVFATGFYLPDSDRVDKSWLVLHERRAYEPRTWRSLWTFDADDGSLDFAIEELDSDMQVSSRHKTRISLEEKQ